MECPYADCHEPIYRFGVTHRRAIVLRHKRSEVEFEPVREDHEEQVARWLATLHEPIPNGCSTLVS